MQDCREHQHSFRRLSEYGERPYRPHEKRRHDRGGVHAERRARPQMPAVGEACAVMAPAERQEFVATQKAIHRAALHWHAEFVAAADQHDGGPLIANALKSALFDPDRQIQVEDLALGGCVPS